MRKNSVVFSTFIILSLCAYSFTNQVETNKEMISSESYKFEIDNQNMNKIEGEKAKLIVQTNLVVDKKTQSTVAQVNVIKDGRSVDREINSLDVLE